MASMSTAANDWIGGRDSVIPYPPRIPGVPGAVEDLALITKIGIGIVGDLVPGSNGACTAYWTCA